MTATIANLTVVATAASAFAGLFAALAIGYRIRLKTSQRSGATLREELAASRRWNDELVAARNVVDQDVTQDPMHLNSQHPQRDDLLEHLFRLPSAIRDHERGQQ